MFTPSPTQASEHAYDASCTRFQPSTYFPEICDPPTGSDSPRGMAPCRRPRPKGAKPRRGAREHTRRPVHPAALGLATLGARDRHARGLVHRRVSRHATLSSPPREVLSSFTIIEKPVRNDLGLGAMRVESRSNGTGPVENDRTKSDSYNFECRFEMLRAGPRHTLLSAAAGVSAVPSEGERAPGPPPAES